jgi:hypothetical protein
MADRPSAIADARFRLFAFLWGAATLFHLASFNRWTQTSLTTLAAVAAVWLLLRPSSPTRLAILAIIQIAEVYDRAPDLSNHWLFTAFVNATVLASIGMLLVEQRRFAIDRSRLFTSFAPAVRVQVLLLYFFTVFHKLNTSFLDPALSCGAFFYARQAEMLGILPGGYRAQAANIAFTLLIEAAIPILLFVRSTRPAGILVAMVFHGLIGINPLSGFYNFSSMIFAVLVLFLPEAAAAQCVMRWTSLVRAMPAIGWVVSIVFAAELVLTVWVGLVRDPVVPIWIGFAAVALIAILSVAFTAPPDTASFRLRGAQLFLPVLVAVNGLTPYLGLKTEHAFSMFSNLRTEGGVSNHLLVPAGPRPFRYQDDLVEVVESSDPFLRNVARDRELVPYFELWRRPRASVVYRANGDVVRLKRVADDARYPGPMPDLLGRLLLFRAVDPGPDQRCRH